MLSCYSSHMCIKAIEKLSDLEKQNSEANARADEAVTALKTANENAANTQKQLMEQLNELQVSFLLFCF